MPKSAKNEGRGRLLLCLGFTALFAMLAILPYWFRSEAGPRTSKQVSASKTSSRDPELPNYDIRTDKAAGNKIIEFRGRVHKDASAIADIRDNFVRGEESLKQRVPTLKVEYNNDLRIPEVIGPDIKQEKAVLASANGQRHSDVLRSFLQQYSDLIGVSSTGEDNLKTFADYKNPDGNLSFVELDQEINGIPVFQGQVKAGFTKKGEMFRVINNLAAGLDNVALQSDFGDSANAVRAAAAAINNQTAGSNLRRNPATSNNLRDVYGDDDWATTAEKTYFPTEPGVALAAWKVLIWQPNNAYYLVIDAETGTLLWRKNLTSDQTQSATYNVYANPNAMINVARNPFPLTPGPTAPGTGVQGSAIARTLITKIGNEPPYDFNNLGWITDGNNTTDGNNVQAGLDRSSPDGIDTAGNGVAVGTNRVFDFPVNPFDPNTNTGDSPIPAGEPTPASSPGTCSTTPANHTMIDYQRASVTQLFYVANWYHDITYTLGFTEAARNYQNDNFGRGGAAADRISAEGQDCSSRNNANFSAPPDGNRGRMQMYLFTGPNPDIDSDFDADVMVHELTHGLSNRLHGNSTGLSNTMAGGMGEGWSDFYALSLLSQPTDPVNGVYAAGPYDTYKLVTNYTDNNYYGIRRFPYAIKSATGGPGNLPFNPITFADIDDSQLNLNDGAFVKSPVGFAPSADEVHNAGEIWCSALWEVRGRFVTRLGWAVGNRKALQLVTDGMKLAPLSPTFISERDAIVAATKAGGTQADLDDVWAGFAARGVGFSASVQQIGTGGPVGNPSVTVPTRVTEAFDLPNLVQTPALTVSDSAGNNNGFPEPGENLTITVPLTNTTGKTANNVTLQLVGGGSANYGTITDGITTSQQVSFTVPANSPCGSAVILTLNINSDLGPTSYTRVITIGVPSATFSENFDSVTAPAFPAGWTAVSVSSGINFVTTTVNSDSGPNSAFAADPTSVGGGSDLTSPSIPITASAATLTFRQRYDTEADWDGGVLEISIAGGAFQDILTAGGSFVQNGYNGNLGAGSVNSPLQTRNAWTGNSSGYITTIVRLPAAAAGQNVQLKWRFGGDNNTAGIGPNPGWNIDNIQIAGNYTCAGPQAKKAIADFDGDGKTDVSVFRPGEGNWWLLQTTAGFGVANWGVATDKLVPGDYDGDGKTDFAVYRDGQWWVVLSSGGYAIESWGTATDIPVPGDYDGDGKTDFAIFRPSEGNWWILKSSGGSAVVNWGIASDKLVPADYDGDGRTDIAIYRGGTWWIVNSSGGVTIRDWGTDGDKLVPADYDGDGKTDLAVYRGGGDWWVLKSTGGAMVISSWGLPTDTPVPGDYDGDGKADAAVYRAEGEWWVNGSTGAATVTSFGTSTDVPIPSRYIP